MTRSLLILIFFAYFLSLCQFSIKETKVDWPAFMYQHDMTFDEFPTKWNESPHFGNALIGAVF